MINILKKGILTGVGLGVMTKDKVEEFAKKACAEAKLSEEEGRKFLEEILSQSKKVQTNIEERVHEQVAKAVESMDLVTKNDLSAIEKQLEELKALLSKDNG